ncbi:MAG TPA: hypothetical protein VFU63_13280 [Ktedonobacterales bacterium]|nr:hypothetical protein [Ktedonobacterales bacterium]
MRHDRKVWAAKLVIELAVAMLVAPVLVGCGAVQSLGESRATGRATASMPPTTITPAAGNIRCGVQALPQGWTWYQDPQYSFRIATPPSWRTGAFAYLPDGSSDPVNSPSHIHVVDFFGPGSVGQATSSGKMRSDTFPPVITIEIDVGQGTRPASFGSGQLSNWHAQPIPVCIGSVPATQYVFSNGEGDVERAVVLDTGPRGYPYTFQVASHADTAVRDGQFFLTALATFSPLPAKP